MKDGIFAIIEESMNLELNISDLYTVFHNSLLEDSEFWWRMILEEKNHAALFRSGLDSLEQINKFPHDILTTNLQILQKTNKQIIEHIEKYKLMPPDRDEAFNLALAYENSAAELHFQKFMDESSDNFIDKIFKELNKADKDHAHRLYKYMEDNNIEISNENLEASEHS